MKCTNCGNDLPENAKFCGVCGTDVSSLWNLGNENSSFTNGEAEEVQTNTVDDLSINGISSDSTNYNQLNTDNNISNYEAEASADDNMTNYSADDNMTNYSADDNMTNYSADDNVDNNIQDSNQNVNSISMGPSIKPIDETNINNQNSINANFNTSQLNVKKKKKILPIVIIGIVFLIAVLIVVGVLFINRKNSPKEIFLNEIRSVTSKLLLEEEIKESSFELGFNTSLSLSTVGYNDIIDLINKMNFTYSNSFNKEKKYMDNSLSIEYDGASLVDLGLYYRNNKMYMDLGDLYSKTVIIPTENIEIDKYISNSNTKEQLENIKEAIDNAFDSAMKEEYFKSSKEEISVNGKSKKITANTMKLSGNELATFLTDIMSSLKDNSNFITTLSTITGLSESEIKEEFNVSNLSNVDATLTLKIYTSGILNDKCEGISVAASKNTDIVSLDIIKENDSKYSISVKSGAVTVTGLLTKQVSSDTTKYSFNIGMGNDNIGFNLSIKNKNKADFKTIDEKNVVTYDEFETNGMEEITNNIEKNANFSKIYEKFTKAMNNTSSYSGDYNYTLDDDFTDYETNYNNITNIYNSI